MDRRRLVLAGSGLLLLAMVARHPSADIRVLTHDAADRSPHEVRAAVDIGVMAITVLVTWTSKRLING